MAERTGRTDHLIPLAHWLSARDAGNTMPPPDPSCSAPAEDRAKAAVPLATAEEAYKRGRQDVLAEMDIRICSLVAEHGKALLQQEEALNARWASHSAMETAGSIAAAFHDLRHQMEDALCEVLRPFLGKAAADRASARLIELVREEALRAPDAILDIKAPAILHERLSDLLSEHGVRVSLSPSDTVEVAARDGTTRFASMATRWLMLLQGDEL